MRAPSGQVQKRISWCTALPQKSECRSYACTPAPQRDERP
jgi:hypothetical protein